MAAEKTPAAVLDEVENTVVDEDASLAVRRYFTIPGRDPFDEINVFGWKRRYFMGIAHHLERMGVTVYQARLPPLAAVPERAARLLEFLRGISAERVNLIAHSMGGLDARYAIARLGAKSHWLYVPQSTVLLAKRAYSVLSNVKVGRTLYDTLGAWIILVIPSVFCGDAL